MGTRVLLPYQRARVMCRPLRRLRLMLLMPSNSVVALHAARWVCCRRLLCCLVSPCFHISSSRVQACIVGRKTDFGHLCLLPSSCCRWRGALLRTGWLDMANSGHAWRGGSCTVSSVCCVLF